MEPREIRRISSTGRNNSFIWGNSVPDVFSRSSRDEDDEEALKWAALEKLPTYSRMRRGILTAGAGGLREVDIENLSYEEKKSLVDRLVRVAEEDNEKFLLKLKNRIDQVGIDLPTIEVRFEQLSVEAETYMGSRAMPTLFNFTANLVEGFLNFLHIVTNRKRPFTILNNINGIIKPCRLTLLLGPPGSGKTTFLLALAGKLSKNLKVSGNIVYNGHEMNEFVPRKTAAYISQHDVHLGEMTVRETLAFSARCQGFGNGYDMLLELSRREKAANIKPDADMDVFMKVAAMQGQEASVVTDYILKILGLDICADTMVGDEMRRGISGGQRKRVTTGEMLVGPARALFMDEISTGLDSSTTFQIVKSLCQSIHILSGTAVISLLQPAPETYDLFDDIILLSEGKIVYQGPREHVLEFFEFMGFKCPERKGVADFLQEVTSSKDQEQYWIEKDEPYRFIPVKEFSDAFLSFHVGKNLMEELSSPFDKSKSHPAALKNTPYGVNKKELLRACFAREILLMKRNSFANIFKMIQLVGLCLITMSVFFRSYMRKQTILDGGIYMGALFFSLNVIMFNGFSDLALAIHNLPVFYKQRDLLFFPAWAYALPTWILRIPISFIESAIWVSLTYYTIGFDPNANRFFRQYLLLVILNQTAACLFRFVASLGRTMLIGNTFGTFFLVILMTLGGFVLSRVDVKVWWKWGYWLSPMSYGINGLSVNEFLGHKWGHIPLGTNHTLGFLILKSRGIFPHEYWFWISVLALLGHIFILNIGYILGLTFLNPLGEHQVFISEESWSEQHAPCRETTVGASSTTRNGSGEGSSNVDSPTSSQNGNRNDHGNKRGMILPFLPLSLAFDEINYSVDMPQEMKDKGIEGDKLLLLKGVSGSFSPGTLTALMGVSGAGKTTLMDVLAGRKTEGYIEGAIKVSGYPKKQEAFARISGYCEQNDIHSPNVTVYESLVFSSWLRLPSEVDKSTRMMFIEEVMELVELVPIRNAIVGLPGVDGLSTEQRKRLTIAVELVANPSIIFMDEPTSGLDARAAAIVMRTVRNTVDTGRTVVCTIHQPSIDIFEAFDELFLLKRGGEEIYVGPLGHNSCHLISYFEAISGVAKIKDGYNPATWMLEVTTPAQEEILDVDFAELYKSSDLYRRNMDRVHELSQPVPGSQDLRFDTKFPQPFLIQCIACLWKQHRSYWKNPSYNAVRFLFSILVALIFGSLFWNIGSNTSKMQDLFNAMGSMFIAVLFLGVLNASTVQPVVSIERTVFYREKAAGMYSAFPYAFGQVVIEFPYVLIQVLAYGIIVYSMMGFEWQTDKFFWFLYFIYVTLLNYTFYGMMTIGITPNQQVAAIISTAFYGLWMLFAGYMIPVKRLPRYWKWCYWITPLAWTLYGLVISQFGDVHDTLESGEDVVQFLRSYFGFKKDFLAVVAVVLPIFPVAFAVAFAISIKVLNFQRR